MKDKHIIKHILISTSVVIITSSGIALAFSHQGCNGDDCDRADRRSERHEKKLNNLKEKLEITDKQENAWQTFVKSMKPPSREEIQKRREQIQEVKEKDMTTPERIKYMQNQRSERYAERTSKMAERSNAVLNFYNQLDAQQKEIFDKHHNMIASKHAGKRFGKKGRGSKGGRKGRMDDDGGRWNQEES